MKNEFTKNLTKRDLMNFGESASDRAFLRANRLTVRQMIELGATKCQRPELQQFWTLFQIGIAFKRIEKLQLKTAESSYEGFKKVFGELSSKVPPMKIEKPLTADEICRRINSAKKKN